jgi:hypothetical protein
MTFYLPYVPLLPESDINTFLCFRVVPYPPQSIPFPYHLPSCCHKATPQHFNSKLPFNRKCATQEH